MRPGHPSWIMPLDIHLDEDLAQRIRALVDTGAYPSADEAVNHLLRSALAGSRRERPLTPNEPLPPPMRDPGDDRPIQVDPWDVTWAP